MASDHFLASKQVEKAKHTALFDCCILIPECGFASPDVRNNVEHCILALFRLLSSSIAVQFGEMLILQRTLNGHRLLDGSAASLRCTQRTACISPRSPRVHRQGQRQISGRQASAVVALSDCPGAAARKCDRGDSRSHPVPAQFKTALLAVGLCLTWRSMCQLPSATMLGSISLSNNFTTASQTGVTGFILSSTLTWTSPSKCTLADLLVHFSWE